MKYVALVVALLLIVFILAACQAAEEPVAKTDNGTLTLDQIAKTLPGFGVVMHRIGLRYTTAYYAAQGGNWDLVDYEIKEIKEELEVGMITRPKRKQPTQAFLDGAFAKFEKAAKTRKIGQFKTAFDSTTKACNGCHAGDDKSFLEYKLPDSAIDVLNVSAK